MERKEIQKIVGYELKHIPRGPVNSLQNYFRSAYTSQRLHSLGKNTIIKLTKEEVLKQAIAAIKDKNPEFEPIYDPDLFLIEK